LCLGRIRLHLLVIALRMPFVNSYRINAVASAARIRDNGGLPFQTAS
jgi:hypothetical protein